MKILPRSFYLRHSVTVAPELLNKILVREDGRAGRIVEVEAYAGTEDAAAHSFKGRTPRNASMFSPGGHLYVYFTYGMHWCANAVCGSADQGWAVLLRALEPLTGLEEMREMRGNPPRDRDLASGPGKLCQAMGIAKALDGADLVKRDRAIWIASDGMPPPAEPSVGARVGIRLATEKPWRWYVAGNPNVSKPR